MVNQPGRGVGALSARQLWASRELVWFLGLRDIKARYKQAVFGIGWAVLQPVLSVAVFTLVFGRLAEVPSQGLPYPVFALLGVSAWQYFATSVHSATSSLVGNAALVTKVYFPRIAAPLAALLHGFVAFVVALVILSGMMAWYRIPVRATVLLLPLCLAGLLVVALGAGLALATLNVKFRDVGQISGLLVQLWLLASPVAYPSVLVPDEWRWLYALNPLTGVIDSFRWAVFGIDVQASHIGLSALSAVALLLLGAWYFARNERQLADVI